VISLVLSSTYDHFLTFFVSRPCNKKAVMWQGNRSTARIRCRCEIRYRYVSKFTAASRGSPAIAGLFCKILVYAYSRAIENRGAVRYGAVLICYLCRWRRCTVQQIQRDVVGFYCKSSSWHDLTLQVCRCYGRLLLETLTMHGWTSCRMSIRLAVSRYIVNLYVARRWFNYNEHK